MQADGKNAHHENQVTIAWCLEHKNIPGNVRAVKLTKEARLRECESTIYFSGSLAKRIAKSTIGRAWKKEWNRNTNTGGFGPTNRIPHTTALTKFFSQTPREVFGRLIQCKTNHGYTGEFRRHFLPQEEIRFPCGEELQSREHIIIHCTLHEGKREELRKISRDIWLPSILAHQRRHRCPHHIPQGN